MRDKAKEAQMYYYYDKLPEGITEWNSDITIYRYMDLDYLTYMLDEKKFYVNSKCRFDDKNEMTLPLHGTFAVHAYGEEISKEVLKQELEKWQNRHKEYKDENYMPTSCWTYGSNENILMWKAYTSRMGVRIKTTFNKLLNALNAKDYDIICGYINYGDYSSHKGLEDYMFTKIKAYSDEREFRIYFQPKEKSLSDKIKQQHSINIEMRTPINIIDEITFSPYVKDINVFKELLKHNFSIEDNKLKKSIINL